MTLVASTPPPCPTGQEQPRWREATIGLAALGLLSTFGLPAAAHSQEPQQDSIAVIERGTPGIEGWDILEFPFRVLALPVGLVVSGVTALGVTAERGHWIPWLTYYDRQLRERGVHLSSRGQGSNSGSGAALLLGWLPEEGSLWANVSGGSTVKGYWQTRAQVGYGAVEAEHVEGPAFGVRWVGSAEHRAEDEFFGVGRDSREEGRSDFALDRYQVGGELAIMPTGQLELEVGAGWERAETGPGSDGRRPDVDSIFEPAEIPGFERREDYLFIGAEAAWGVGHPHAIERGGRWASIGYRWNRSDTEGAADFGHRMASAGIDLPFDHRIRSLALALFYESLRPGGSGDLAFHRLPTLGGRALPSYRTDRFRDRDLILGQAEYRYRLWDDPRGRFALDASVFLYGGMVARSLSREFRFDRLQESYGIALGLLTETSRIARLALALGGERTQVLLTFAVGS